MEIKTLFLVSVYALAFVDILLVSGIYWTKEKRRDSHMKCPFCGQEMEQGKLRSRGGLFFLPEGEGLPKLYTRREMEKHRAVYLPPYALRWWADYPAAQICRSCSKIVVDYN